MFAITGLVTSVFLILISAYEISETTVRLHRTWVRQRSVNINNDRATLDINGKRYVCVLTQDPDGDVRSPIKQTALPGAEERQVCYPEDFGIQIEVWYTVGMRNPFKRRPPVTAEPLII